MHQPTDQNPPLHNHSLSTLSLCICTLCHCYLLISIFPYSGFMTLHFLPHLTYETTGFYSGFLASSFMIGRSISSYPWGLLADTIGRKPVLTWSLLFSCLFSFLFGLSPNFTMALLFRFFLGFSSSIVSTTKTVVSELAYGDSVLETRAMGLVIGMRGWGFLMSPAIGGVLAEPIKQYPNSSFGSCQTMLELFPFLLPNVVGALLCLISVVCVYWFVEETLPVEKRRRVTLEGCRIVWNGWRDKVMSKLKKGCSYDAEQRMNGDDLLNESTSEKTSLLSTSSSPPPIDSARTMDNGTSETKPTLSSIWSNPSTKHYLQLYWIYSFLIMSIDEAFPLFCLSPQAGLGYAESSIGTILSGSGLLFAIGQYFVYTTIVHNFGLFNSLKIGCWFSVPLCILIPFSIVLNHPPPPHQNTTANNIPTTIFLGILMAIIRIFASVYFSSITIVTNRTVTISERATLNGVSMLGGSIAKAIGPLFAGVLVGISLSMRVVPARVRSVLIWGIISGLGLGVVRLTYRYLEEEVDDDDSKMKKREKEVEEKGGLDGSHNPTSTSSRCR